MKERTEESATFALSSDEATYAIWPYDFELQYTVEIEKGGNGLSLELSVTNTQAEKPLTFTGCLHTYLHVNSEFVEVDGLEEKFYMDKCDKNTKKEQHPGRWTPKTEAGKSGRDAGKKGYVDRVYDACDLVTVVDHNKEVTFEVRQSPAWTHTTVYNPWQGDKLGGKKAGLDFDDNGYLHMLCVEPTIGDYTQPIFLGAGDTWYGAQSIRVRNKKRTHDSWDVLAGAALGDY